jgi:hypothetical protein
MSKVKLEVTLEDAFIIGQVEGQKKLITELVNMFCTEDFVDKQLFVTYLNVKLSLLNDVEDLTKTFAQGLREPKQ